MKEYCVYNTLNIHVTPELSDVYSYQRVVEEKGRLQELM